MLELVNPDVNASNITVLLVTLEDPTENKHLR